MNAYRFLAQRLVTALCAPSIGGPHTLGDKTLNHKAVDRSDEAAAVTPRYRNFPLTTLSASACRAVGK
ncbi:hypothetical protein M0R45_024275 [Rubus argutus]|uniref:Secreted protein n=1 Tax=Rubus argutus TaxID=59490 RepID=A0AAW1WTQ7_RUBAR